MEKWINQSSQGVRTLFWSIRFDLARDTKERSELLAACFTRPTQTTCLLTCPIAYFLFFYKWAPKRACSSSHPISVAILGYVWESQHAPFQDNPPLIGNSSCFSAVAPPTHGLRFFLCHFIMDAMDDTTARLQVAPGGTRC